MEKPMEASTNGKALLQQAAERQRALQNAAANTAATQRLSLVLPMALSSTTETNSPAVAVVTAEKLAAREAERQELERQHYIDSVKIERKRRIQLLEKDIGAKYIAKDLATREYFGSAADQEKQRDAFSKVESFIARLKDGVESGKNLLLVGSRGTGKDFCLANCLKLAIWRFGFRVLWMDGSRLFLNLRDSMNKHAAVSEAQFIQRLMDSPILAFSDPMPAMGNLSEFQASMLLSVIDARYRGDRPTWMTLNVSSRKEAEQRMGAMLVDRLFENSEVIFFDWPSYREYIRTKSR